MKYTLDSFLPINAFTPRGGNVLLWGMTLEGGGGGGGGGDKLPSVSDVGGVFSDVGNTISDTVSNTVETVGDVGNQIDQSVNDNIPGGWATVGATALTAATLGGSLAAEGALEGGALASEELASAAPEIVDATSSVAPTIASDVGAQTASQAALDNLVAQQSALYPAIGDTIVGLPQVGSAALAGAGKGILANVAVDALTGQPITPQGLATSAVTGAVGGGAGNVAGQLGADAIGSGIAGGGAGGATGALINNGDVSKSALTGALTGGLSGATNDLYQGLDPSLVAAGKSVQSGLTNAALTGNTNNLAENLVGGALTSAGLTSAYNTLPSLSDAKQLASEQPTQKADTAMFDALVNAFQNPTDTSNNPTSYPLASANVPTIAGLPSIDDSGYQTGGIGLYNPSVGEPSNDSIGKEINPSELTPKQQYENLLEVGVSPEEASSIADYTPVEQPEESLAYNPPIEEQINNITGAELPPPNTSGDGGGLSRLIQGTGPATPAQVADNTPIDPEYIVADNTPVEQPISNPTPIDLTPINNQIDGLNTGLTNLTGTVSGLGRTVNGIGTDLTNLTGTVGGIGTDLTNLTGTVGGLGQTLDTTNKTIAENQAQTEEKLNNLSDAQKAQVASQVAMGVSLTAAINSVQSSLLKQSTDASNAQIQSSALSNSQAQSQTGSGNIPTPISGQTLAGAPVYNTNTQILRQLQQLDPKLLSKIAPHLANTNLTQSGLSALASPQQSSPQQSSPQQSDPYASLMQTMLSDKSGSNPSSGLSRTLMSSGLSALNGNVPGYKKGGSIQHHEQDDHIPEFITGATGHYVKGKGDGQSDDIPAMLADGEYVFDADTVAQLGNGSSDAGAKLLDHFRESLREHKRSAPSDKIPPAASPLAYMKEALRRHSKG